MSSMTLSLNISVFQVLNSGLLTDECGRSYKTEQVKRLPTLVQFSSFIFVWRLPWQSLCVGGFCAVIL